MRFLAGRIPFFLLLLTLLSPVLSPAPAAAASPAPAGSASAGVPTAEVDPLLAGLSEAEILRLGEAMYRHGILADGEAMTGFIRGDIEVDGTAFSCSSCHLRAGLGSFEGGVVTPPTTGRELYQPYRRPPSLNDLIHKEGRYVYAKTILERPAYNRDTLKEALLYGDDPAGETFNDIMPRYPLDDRNLAIMVRYLELLSADYSPGAALGKLKFATIITDDVSPAERKDLLEPLQRFVAGQNQQVGMYRDFIKFGYQPTGDMKNAFRTVSLQIWDLKGPAETWGAQLAAYQAKDQVFAVLGGISNQPWQPIHDFCETQRIPCLYPITDLPVVSPDDWYTLYFNKGYFQEGDAAARFLHRMPELDPQTVILQLVEDTPIGRALAAGFTSARRELGLPEVETLQLSSAELQNQQQLVKLVSAANPGILLVWASDRALPALPALMQGLRTPQQLFLSSKALGTATATLPEELRERTYLTFPFRLNPYFGDEEGTGFLARVPLNTTWQSFADRRIASRTVTMLSQAVTQGLQSIYDNLYRDHLLDVMSMQMDRVVYDYERLSFGPGQRYASKGCYIIQLGPGAEPELIPRSEWVIH